MDFSHRVAEAFFYHWNADLENQILSVILKEHYASSRHSFLYEVADKQLLVTNPIDYPKLAELPIDQKTDIDTIHKMIDDESIIRIPDNGLSYLDPENLKSFNVPEEYKIEPIDEGQETAFDTFLKACSEEDKKQGQVSITDQLVTALYYKSDIVGISSYWFEGPDLADIGIIIHPDHRKKGMGKVLLAHQCKRGLELKKINQYRYDVDNLASQALCRSIGFEELISLKVLELKNR